MDLLEKARLKIDAIDHQMAQLFEERMQAVQEVAAYKKLHHKPIFDEAREQQVIAKNTAYIQDPAFVMYYEQLQKDMMKVSKSYQKALLNQNKIGYAGCVGAFSYLAAKHVDALAKHVAYDSFEAVVDALSKNEIACAVLPFENSYTGEVGEIMDLFLEKELYIEAVFDMRIHQHLLGIKGASLTDIKKVYSKDQAIFQCQSFFQGKDVELIPYSNTAMAAKFVVQENEKSNGAIASEETAALYGLDILVKDINTSMDNTTRFIVVKNTMPQQGDRVALLFTLPHKPGALAKVMTLIQKYGWNMESIHSRSLKKQAFAYYFYVALETDFQKLMHTAFLEDMRQACDMVKIVGVYTKKGSEEICDF